MKKKWDVHNDEKKREEKKIMRTLTRQDHVVLSTTCNLRIKGKLFIQYFTYYLQLHLISPGPTFYWQHSPSPFPNSSHSQLETLLSVNGQGHFMSNKGGIRYAVVSFLVWEVILPRNKNLLDLFFYPTKERKNLLFLERKDRGTKWPGIRFALNSKAKPINWNQHVTTRNNTRKDKKIRYLVFNTALA